MINRHAVKALPPAPERKLLTGKAIGIDPSFGKNYTIIEKWIRRCGEITYERVLYTPDGRILSVEPSLYWHGQPPFVKAS